MKMLRRAMTVLVVVAGAIGATHASAAPYAALVMDARDGRVLHARSADRKLHPASLTKMMTLYLTFEAVTAGKLSLDQRVKVSRRVAAQPASKIGLRRGQRVTVRDLIRATAVKSANDAAVALAEAIGGDEATFARMMTNKARRMGMTRTTFKNASGLTARGQYSTARDMARLGRALFYDFPQYYNLFGRKTTHAVGKTIRSTNRRHLGSYKGADGIKTGYTAAAGFNLVSSARRGDKRIIAVMFGGRSSVARNRRVAELLDMGFERAPARASVRRPSTRLASLTSPPPRARPGAARGAIPQSIEIDRLLAQVGDAIVPKAAAATRPAVYTKNAPRSAPPPAMRPGSSLAAAPTATGRGPSTGARASSSPVTTAKPWAVQVGVFADEDTAVAELASVALSDVGGLSRAGRQVAEMTLSGRRAYRARLTGFDQIGALSACEALKSKGRDCLPIRAVAR